MEVIYKAGPLVAVLFFVSILTIAFALERFWALNIARGKVSPAAATAAVKERLAKRDFPGAIAAAEGQLGSVGRILAAGIRRYATLTGKLPERTLRAELDLAFQEANVMEGALLERNIIPLATVGSIANLIGLLGTVLGMIQSFAAISATGTAEKIAASRLASGIATALVNAAGGLIVAIMAVIFYNFFLSRIDRLNFDIEEASDQLLEACVSAERKKG
jgi:biopolymer transport protein ExbB